MIEWNPTAKNPVPAATLRILGHFSLHDDRGRAVRISSKKNRALIAILALSPNHSATREQIAMLLWGNRGEVQSRSSLRQALAVLRRELGSMHERMIRSEEGDIALQAGCVSIDAVEILACADVDDIVRLRHAAGHCHDELLADLSIDDEPFEEWLAGERSRLRTATIRMLDRLAQLEAGPSLVNTAQLLLHIDPLRESSHRILMRAYADQGENGLALRQYDLLRTMLRKELQIDPAPETQELRRAIARSARGVQALADEELPAVPAIPPKLSDRPSIAVLPFDNANRDQDQAFYSDGITEELIANLSRFRRLLVISRASSFAFRDRTAGARLIGGELGVDFLLYGSVRRTESRLRVTAELVRADNEAVIWVERYDRTTDAIFDVVDEMCSMIVASIVGRLEDELLRNAKRKPTESLAAFELALRGRALMHGPGRADKLEARRFFEEAVRLDPSYAMALTQLAYTHLYEFFWDDSGRALEKAAKIASSALLVDEEEAWCHMVLGLTHLHRRQFDLAVKHCERAVNLNPSDPHLAAKFGLVLTDVGRPAEAIVLIEKAMHLNPLHPEIFHDYLALALFGARRYGAALRVLRESPEPTFYYHVWMAACLVHLGDLVAARAEVGKAIEFAPDFTISRFAAMEPIRDPLDLAHWTDALRLAGFPD